MKKISCTFSLFAVLGFRSTLLRAFFLQSVRAPTSVTASVARIGLLLYCCLGLNRNSIFTPRNAIYRGNPKPGKRLG